MFLSQDNLRGLIKPDDPRFEDPNVDEDTRARIRVSLFVEMINFNNKFANTLYLLYGASRLTPFMQYFLLRCFIGSRFYTYGWDVLVYLQSRSDPWPNPMDVLFPKMAKCEYNQYGMGGDIETLALQCQLPMNNINEYIFFFYWWWLVILFIINLVTSFKIFAECLLPIYRNRLLRSYAIRAIASALLVPNSNLVQPTGLTLIQARNSIRSVLKSSFITYGDYLILKLLRANIAGWQFRKFICCLVITRNPVLYLRYPKKQAKTAETSFCENRSVSYSVEAEIINMESGIEYERKVANISMEVRPLITLMLHLAIIHHAKTFELETPVAIIRSRSTSNWQPTPNTSSPAQKSIWDDEANAENVATTSYQGSRYNPGTGWEEP